MKILELGVKPLPEKPKAIKWWAGLKIKCRDCGTIFELEEEDKPVRYLVECPQCKRHICPGRKGFTAFVSRSAEILNWDEPVARTKD